MDLSFLPDQPKQKKQGGFDLSSLPDQPKKEPTWADLPSNLKGSAVQFFKDLVTPVIHPIQTAKGIGSLATGAYHKLTPGVQEDEQLVDAILQHYSERYGGLDRLKKTIIKDPVGFAADLGSILME